MRLGANFGDPFTTEEEWNEKIRDLGVEVLMSAVTADTDEPTVARYIRWVQTTGLEIAEVGVWNNPIADNKAERATAIAKAQKALALADRMGAACCVNISGGRGKAWDGYDPRNYSKETYDLVVASVREIIDAVKPTHTCYSLEPMPWMYPSSPEEYLQLMRDVDREAFGVHLDFANMINGIERYHDQEAFLDRCFSLLGPYIRSIHFKDVQLMEGLPCLIHEVLPGRGGLHLTGVLRRIERLGRNLPVFVEHLERYEDYKTALASVRALRAEMETGRGEIKP
ncbi:MAG: sugar phosphate isomerase/epimerase [Eubacteriales bacterium]|nr:sugar phosphate isomerase/epimerase [Eubacteriales bacterium]